MTLLRHSSTMNACNKPPNPAAPPHDAGYLGNQASSVPAIPSTPTCPSDSSAPQIESSLLVLDNPGNGPPGSGDMALHTALDSAQRDSSGPGSTDAVVSTQRSRLPAEDYRRPILVVKKDGNDIEDLKLFFALFDTGSSDVNLISAKLVKYLELEMRDRSRWSRILDVLFPWRKKSQLCNTDGTSIRQEGKVEIRWYCRDQTVYDKQALWFTPGFYVTEHFVVENATADVLFSLSTWDELGLRDRPISMITRKPQPDMSKGNLQKVAADKAKQTETRIGKKSKSAAATMEAYRAKKAAKYSSSSSNGMNFL
ncbi:hypothetical protein IWX90DRAFT_72215 [Phyllosticta citrichinensis]|uniref:Uncharacterized protein n=1 Tax=Phyllosticta citrichinensis TaxID=1130410 RepID=A0ABR1XGM0_9PEZI